MKKVEPMFKNIAKRIIGPAVHLGTLNQFNREKWLEKTLKLIPSGSRILDAGAGEQQYKRFCKHLKYVAQDFAQYDGKGDGKGLQMRAWDQSKLDIISDITSIPEPDASFDAVLCVEVFEHLPDPISAVKEFSRLLRPGGYLILTAPFCSLTHFSPYHFCTGYNRYWYETHLPGNGFKIVSLEANGNYFDYLAQEVRRLPEMVSNYTKLKSGVIEAFLQNIFLFMLQKYQKNDRGSSEMLTHGYHVLAKKEGRAIG